MLRSRMLWKVGLGLIVIATLTTWYSHETRSQSYLSLREIFNKVYDHANTRLMTTAGLTAQPVTRTETEILNNVYDAANNLLRTSGGGEGGGSSAFEDLTSGTNTSAAMVVGTGASLATSGSGTITATTAAALASNPAACSANQFANDIAADGTLTCAQPAFSNLSGAATDAQIPNLNTLSTGLTASRGVTVDGSAVLVSLGSPGVGTTDAQTLTNKRITARTLAHADAATINVDSDLYDIVVVAELSQTTAIAPPTGTPTSRQRLTYSISSTTARTLNISTAANGFSETAGVAIPVTTIAGKWLDIYTRWNDTTSKWEIVSVSQFREKLCTLTSSSNHVAVDANCPGGKYALTLSENTTFDDPTGTFTDGMQLKIRVIGGSAYTTAWGSAYSANAGFSLPTAIQASVENHYLLERNSTAAKWVLTASNAPVAGAGGTRFIHLPVIGAHQPSSNPAIIDRSENHERLLFDATTAECVWWNFVMNEDYSSGLVAKIPYSAASATSGTFIAGVYVMATSPGDSADNNTDSYDTVNTSAGSTVPGTAGYPNKISVTLTNADSVAAGDNVRLKLCRDISDTASGDIEVLNEVLLQYTAQ